MKNKDLKKETEYMLAESGKHIAEYLTQSAFKLFKDERLRKEVNFDKLPQLERDRIFNELEVTLIGLIVLKLDDALAHSLIPEEIDVLTKLQKSIKNGFLEILKSLGIENRFLKEWDTLIEMRLKEYRQDYKLLMNESKKWEGLNIKEDLRPAFARIQTITLDCVSHIRRGDLKEDDPLIRLLRRSFIEMDAMFEKLIQTVSKGPVAQS